MKLQGRREGGLCILNTLGGSKTKKKVIMAPNFSNKSVLKDIFNKKQRTLHTNKHNIAMCQTFIPGQFGIYTEIWS